MTGLLRILETYHEVVEAASLASSLAQREGWKWVNPTLLPSVPLNGEQPQPLATLGRPNPGNAHTMDQWVGKKTVTRLQRLC